MNDTFAGLFLFELCKDRTKPNLNSRHQETHCTPYERKKRKTQSALFLFSPACLKKTKTLELCMDGEYAVGSVCGVKSQCGYEVNVPNTCVCVHLCVRDKVCVTALSLSEK